MEETLTLQQLGWRNSAQKQRWCAAPLLEIEQDFRRVRGHAHMPLLQAALVSKLITSTAA